MSGELGMGSKIQVSGANMRDALTNQPVGEGFISLTTSAGNRLTFQDPGSAYRYQQANPAQFNVDTQGMGGGQFNDTYQNPV